jgi:ketosteroid isomerase-like protein
MRRLMLAVLLACAGTSAGSGQRIPESDAESKIIALENVWNQAAQGKDLKALAALLDDAFVYVDPDGKMLTKVEVLADVQASRGLQIVSESMVVHLHGDTAVVTGIYQIKGVDRGKAFVRRDRFVDTWHYTNGAWRSIASLATPIGS